MLPLNIWVPQAWSEILLFYSFPLPMWSHPALWHQITSIHWLHPMVYLHFWPLLWNVYLTAYVASVHIKYTGYLGVFPFSQVSYYTSHPNMLVLSLSHTCKCPSPITQDKMDINFLSFCFLYLTSHIWPISTASSAWKSLPQILTWLASSDFHVLTSLSPA